MYAWLYAWFTIRIFAFEIFFRRGNSECLVLDGAIGCSASFERKSYGKTQIQILELE